MSKLPAKQKHGFEVGSVSGALRKSDYARVAKKGDLEVWASKYRTGERGRRYYRVKFEALRVVTAVPGMPREVEDVKLPDTCRSDLVKALAFLATSQESSSP